MPTYYDSNFGHYEIEGSEDVEFYHDVQARSVLKRCQGCGAKVRILPDYAYCNTCADVLERGGDLEGYACDEQDEDEGDDHDD